MSPDKEDGHDGSNAITYPSPGAEPLDAGPFYHTGPRDDGPPEHQAQPGQHLADHVHEQIQDHTQAKQDHSEIPTEPVTPQQHASRPANLEELQLAAQLGQGLTGIPIMPGPDPNMNSEDPSMRSILAHAEGEPQQQQQQQHHHQHHAQQHHQQEHQQDTPSYIQDTPTSEPMTSHVMPLGIAPSPMGAQYGLGDNVPPRKRSKVSRACDECRRKKIKCDAQSDTGDTPCSSCGRSNIRCLFSRVPQKRGPSKGYIKELADRINSIESKLTSEGTGNLSQEELEALGLIPSRRSVGAGDDPSRKRPYSSISGGDFGTPTTTRQGPQVSWGSEHRPIQPATSQGESHHLSPYNSASLAPQPQPFKLDDTPSKQPEANMDVSMLDSEDIPEVDEGILQDYLNTVQGLYPILPNNRDRVQQLLSACPPQVRTAFNHALSAVAQSSSGNVKLASSLLNDWESSDAPRNQATNIVHAQTLILLIIDADWRSSPTLPALFGRALALTHTMRLWRLSLDGPVLDLDSDENLSLRIWWSLVLIDRYYSVGTGRPVQIPDSSAIVQSELVEIIGENFFYLLRLSKILSKITQVTSQLPPGATAASSPVAAVLIDYVENFREDLPSHVDFGMYPLVHMSYWHCRTLAALLSPDVNPSEIMWPTKELIDLLSVHADLRIPLLNHFAQLVVLSLTKLSRLEKTREEAVQHAQDVLSRPEAVWDSIRDKLAEQVRLTPSNGMTSQTLQQLANLATAEGEDGSGETQIDPSLALGYLDVV